MSPPRSQPVRLLLATSPRQRPLAAEVKTVTVTPTTLRSTGWALQEKGSLHRVRRQCQADVPRTSCGQINQESGSTGFTTSRSSSAVGTASSLAGCCFWSWSLRWRFLRPLRCWFISALPGGTTYPTSHGILSRRHPRHLAAHGTPTTHVGSCRSSRSGRLGFGHVQNRRHAERAVGTARRVHHIDDVRERCPCPVSRAGTGDVADQWRRGVGSVHVAVAETTALAVVDAVLEFWRRSLAPQLLLLHVL